MESGMVPNLILAGILCAGKSSVGKLLADKLEYEHVDTDDLIVKKIDRAPSEVIRILSREAFQREEALLISSLPDKPRRVISLGSGTLALDNAFLSQNLNKLRSMGTLIHLDATPEVLYQRYLNDSFDSLRRKEVDMFDAISTKRNKRLGVHQEACRWTIDTSELSLHEVAQIILKKMEMLITA
jgi:shikimate kinase